jgi:hypothetical protein
MIDTAAHFMIAIHPNEVGRLIAQHVHSAEARSNSEPFNHGRQRLAQLRRRRVLIRPDTTLSGSGTPRVDGGDLRFR